MEWHATVRGRPAGDATATVVTLSERRSRRGRPYRRLRRWARHTPNGEMAITLICLGVAFLALAAILAVVM